MDNTRLKKSVSDFLSNIDTNTERNEQEIKVLQDSLTEEVIKPFYFDLTLDWSSHFTGRYDGKKLRDILQTEDRHVRFLFSDLDMELSLVAGSIIRLYLEGKLSDGLLDLYTSLIHMYNVCSICGKKVSFFQLERNHPCELPEGLSTYEVELDVPSGKLVLANDLRRYCYDEDGKVNESSKYVSKVTSLVSGLSALRGVQAHAVYHSTNGLGYVSTTRSSSILQTLDGSIIISPLEEGIESNPAFQGYIWTNLWAVCLMDYAHLSRILSKSNRTIEEALDDPVILSVIPGKYILKVNIYENVDDQEEGEITATLTKLSNTHEP